MEPDRYQQNQKFYIIGLVCLVVSLGLFGTGAYILPHVAFGLNYNISDLIFNWITTIQETYEISENLAGWLVFLIFFLLGFIFAIVTYVVSHRIDNEIYEIEPEQGVEENAPNKQFRKETGPFILKIVLILGVIFMVAEFFRWVISS